MSQHDPDQDPDGLLLSEETGKGFISGIDGLDDFKLREVEFSVVDGNAVFEGCIILGTADDLKRTSEKVAQLGGQSQAEQAESFGILIAKRRYFWPKGIVPYRIAGDLPNPERVLDAIAHWQSKTDILFVDHSGQTDHITFRPSTGCSSHVGRQRGEQFVNLGPHCTTGNTIHEIGHALGLWHEQSRADRDAYIEVRLENVVQNALHNFNQKITDGNPHGGYDFGSIMHYPTHAFSKNGEPTIVAKNGEAIGQRTGLSAGDAAAIQSAYAAEFARR